MIAAIYARKSTEQADDASVERQEELARAFAASKGWAVADAHVYVDKATSGAEYQRRPGYQRMMAALDPAPPFEKLIVMEQSRLGRDTGRVLLAIQALEEAGVEIWSYQGGGSRISVEDESGEVNATVLGLVDKMHKRQASKRGRETGRAKAEKGFVAGSKVFGYRNVRRVGHVVREIDEREAAVVRRIFSEIASGRGFIRVARALTADQAPAPRPGQGWGASSVRAVVFQPLYRGQMIYGRRRWAMKAGTKVKLAVPEAEWVRLDVPSLRIVTEAEWRAAHHRLDRTRQTYLRATNGQLGGRPESGIESKWLLTGFLTCAVCAGGLSATWSLNARRERQPYYRCNTHRVRPERCANRHIVPLVALDQDVLRTLREDVLTPARIERVIDRALDLHASAGDTATQREALLDTLRTLDRDLAQYARAVASAPDLAVLVETMRATQRQRDEVAARLAHLDGLDRAVATWSRQDGLGAELRARLDEWQVVLAGQPVLARQVLRRLLAGRLTVTPEEDGRGRCTGHRWAGTASYGRLLGGLVGGQPFGGPSSAACYHDDNDDLQAGQPLDEGGRRVGLATFLERTWSGLTGLVKPRSAATMFRLADQYRHEGRYEEAADLIAEGLRVAPNIAVGHLLDAYVHVVFREMPAAKTSFRRVLSLDPYHPRALFGLARIALEEGDIEGCRPFLDRAIQYFPDFPEAKALQEMVATWSAPAAASAATVGAINTDRLRLPQNAHDLILTHADGTLVFAQGSEERQRQLSLHMAQVYRIASATLARAGLGAMRRGVVEGSSEMTFIRSDGGVILGVALPREIEVGAGLVQVGRLWTDLNIKS